MEGPAETPGLFVSAHVREEPLACDELARLRRRVFARVLDPRGGIGFAEEDADLRAFEQRDGVGGMLWRHAIERVSRIGEAARRQIQHAELEIVAERVALRRARFFER